MAESKKILIAEDEAPLANALQTKLKNEGFVSTIASDGAEVINSIKNDSYDLILLDLMMPNVDGFSVLSQMKEMGNKTPVIVTSNLSQEEDVAKAKSLGAINYLVKSNTSLSEIVTTIKKSLSSPA